MVQLRARDNIALFAFHTFLVEVHPNEAKIESRPAYITAGHAFGLYGSPTTNQTTNQTTTQTTNQTTNQPTNQPTNQTTNQTTNQLNKPTNQQANKFANN